MIDTLKNKLQMLKNTGFFHIFGGSVLNKVVYFLSSIILVRLLTKAEYGVFSYAWNIFSFILLFSGGGIVSGILQLCSENNIQEERSSQFYRYGCWFGLKTNIMLAVIIFQISVMIPLPIYGANSQLLILSLLPVFMLGFELQSTYLRTQKRNKEYAFISVINVLLVSTGTILGAIWFREKGLVYGRYIAFILTILIAFKAYKVSAFSVKAVIAPEIKKILLKISLISMLNNGISQFLYLTGIFIIGIVIPNEEIVASYKIATTIPEALVFVPSALITYIYPYFAQKRDDIEWVRTAYSKVLVLMGILNAVISGTLFLLAPFIIKTVFGSQYLDAVLPFRILSVSYFFSGTFRVLAGNILVTQRRLKYNLLVAVISGVINIIGNIVFISRWGFVGAAVSTLIVVVISGILNTGYLYYDFTAKTPYVIHKMRRKFISRS